MNYWFKVEERPNRGWWVVIRKDVFKDGRVATYINDILDDKESALKSAEESRARNHLWDHYKALKMNS